MNIVTKYLAAGAVALSLSVALAPLSAFAEDASSTDPTVADLEAKISSLTAEVASLKAFITSHTGEPEDASSTPGSLGGVGHMLPPQASPVAHCELFVHSLAQGSTDADTGGEVSSLQKLLAEDPTVFPQGLVTGFFGPLTANAVTKFQLKNHIISASSTAAGIVGPQTRGALSSFCGRMFGGQGNGNDNGNGEGNGHMGEGGGPSTGGLPSHGAPGGLAVTFDIPGTVTLSHGQRAQGTDTGFSFILLPGSGPAVSTASTTDSANHAYVVLFANPCYGIQGACSMMPMKPGTASLAVGESTTYGDYTVTLTAIDSGKDTFSVSK